MAADAAAKLTSRVTERLGSVDALPDGLCDAARGGFTPFELDAIKDIRQSQAQVWIVRDERAAVVVTRLPDVGLVPAARAPVRIDRLVPLA